MIVPKSREEIFSPPGCSVIVELGSGRCTLNHVEELDQKCKNRVHFISPFCTRQARAGSSCRIERKKKGKMVRNLDRFGCVGLEAPAVVCGEKVGG